MGLLGCPLLFAQAPSFFGINNVGNNTRSLVRMELDGTSSTIGTIVVVGGSAAGDVQAISFDTNGTLWATTNGSCPATECLLEFPNPLSSAVANNAGALIFGGSLNITEVASMCPHDNGQLVIVDALGGGRTIKFDPRNLATFTDYGGPASGDIRAMARFPSSSWGNPPLTGDWIYCVEDANQLCVFELSTGTQFLPPLCGYQNVHGMTAAPDGFLYAYDWVTKMIIRVRPSDGTCVTQFGPYPFNQVLSLAYFNPCDIGACNDCDANGVADSIEIANGSPDCNQNGVPDVCEVAIAVARNGSGANPSGFIEVSPAVIGASWNTSVEVITPGAIASTVSIGLGGAVGGIPTGMGELLCLPPFLNDTVFATGQHSLLIPDDCGLIGLTLCAQGSTISLGPLVIQLNNAIDARIGAP